MTFGKTDQGTRRVLGPAAGTHLDQRVASIFVTAPDGLTLHVRRYGSRVGPALPVVCLPGLARTAADFHPLAAGLAADPAKPRLVLAIDYRGHGQSEYDRNPDNYTLPVTLADLSAVLIEGQSSASINQLSRLPSSLSPSLGQLLQINVCVTRPLPWGGADVVNQLLRSFINFWDYITPICFRNTLRECTLVHAHSD